MSVWRERARRRIAELVAELPKDANIAQRRRALWGKGWPAHKGTSWGRKMWGKEVRLHLAKHGAEPKSVDPKFEWPSDIAFPFREQGGGK